MSEDRSSTIGRERLTNYALKATDKEEFIDLVTEDLPDRPDYFSRAVALNRSGATLLSDLAELPALTPAEVVAAQGRGAVVLDTRHPDAFGAGHIPGAVNIALEGQFATWVGTLAGAETDLVIVADDDARVQETRTRLARIGNERAIGYVKGGMQGWNAAAMPLETVRQLDPKAAAADLAGGGLQLIDVRRPPEWATGHIPGAVHIPLNELLASFDQLDRTRPVATYCAGGYRSSIAASLLERAGFKERFQSHRRLHRVARGGPTARNVAARSNRSNARIMMTFVLFARVVVRAGLVLFAIAVTLAATATIAGAALHDQTAQITADASPAVSASPSTVPQPDASATPRPRAITVKARLTQFYQALAQGESNFRSAYGAKADVLLNADLAKLGAWNGLSLTVQAEYNFGANVNGGDGIYAPVNTALAFPAMNTVDLSSVFFGQRFNNSTALLVGKINIIDLAGPAAFKGGAGIDSFWNISFAAPPSGTVPPYLLGALLSVITKGPTYGFWVYDPESKANQGLNDAFANGVTFRANVEFPITIGPNSGHQGFVALYSTQPGTDLSNLDDLLLPSPPMGTPGIKNGRYYFNYTFDQYLYRSKNDPTQNYGLFGQFGISDGNPNKLYWSALAGVGGTGLIPGRSRDNWGIGFYDDAFSPYLINSLKPVLTIRNEYGSELFYNFPSRRTSLSAPIFR